MIPATIGDVLVRAAVDDPGRPFVRFVSGESASIGDQVTRSSVLAEYLTRRGLQRGDRVLLMLDNEPAFLDTWFACVLAGLVMVPVNTAMSGPLLVDLVGRVGPAAMVAAPAYTERLGFAGAPAVRLASASGSSEHGWKPMPEPGFAAPAFRAVASGAQEPVSIIFTSGTTGRSKGVVLSNAHCIARSTSYIDGLHIDATDVMYTCLPLFHNNAQMASVLVALLAGGSVVISPRFSVSRFWTEIAEFEATRVTLIGRMANQLYDLVEAEVPSHRLRTACIVPPPRAGQAFSQRFAVRVVSQYYGCTEMIPMPPDIEQPQRSGSCGRPDPDFECEVVDPQGYPVDPGVVGELVARPRLPSGMMSGYLDMPDATLTAFRGLWFHTGDAMRRDAEGFYYLVGRLGDFIRHRGENVSASEVEALVEEHPGVVGAAVVGEPDEWGEERIVLYIETVDPAVDGATIANFCEETLPDFMRPHDVIVIPELPRNSLGRVEKRKLAGSIALSEENHRAES